MCDCASCSYTDSFATKGFAAWPRGEPAGKRSDAAYAAHVRNAWAGAYKRIPFKPGQAPTYPSWLGTRQLDPGGDRTYPNGSECDTATYVAEFLAANKYAKEAAPERKPRPARPRTPAKAREHFPELDRQHEAATIYAMRKAKPKRSRGRPPLPGRFVVVKLEERLISKAEKLGGKVTVGIREALKRVKVA